MTGLRTGNDDIGVGVDARSRRLDPGIDVRVTLERAA
jgi:hypothetical protein